MPGSVQEIAGLRGGRASWALERAKEWGCDTSLMVSAAQRQWMGWMSLMLPVGVSGSVAMARGAGRESAMGAGGPKDARRDCYLEPLSNSVSETRDEWENLGDLGTSVREKRQ